MIEFKAECGHTVRAGEEDAGEIVRCSYCGRTTIVPTPKTDLSSLLAEAKPVDPSTLKKRFWPRWRRRGEKKRRKFDVFSIVFRSCYAIVLLGVTYFLTSRYLIPRIKREARPPAARPAAAQDAEASPVLRARPGLMMSRKSGVYVHAQPRGATAYFLPLASAPLEGRIHRRSGVVSTQADAAWVRLADGDYMAEVTLPWNAPALADSRKPYYDDYIRFRRELEEAAESEREQLLARYFVPDDAVRCFADETLGQILIVRQYRPIAVSQGRGAGLRPLFLPRVTRADSDRLAYRALLRNYLPKNQRYGFDVDWVRGELRYHDVDPEDTDEVIDMLERIGVCPYVREDGESSLFRIGVIDGGFSALALRNPQGPVHSDRLDSEESRRP